MAVVLSSDSLHLGLGFILAASLLGPCLSAPSTPDPWWYQPCTSDIPKIRHGRSTTDHLANVKKQLRVFVFQLAISIKKINHLYSKQVASKHNTPLGSLKWLRLPRMLKTLKKSRNILPEFYKDLQYFAGTLEVLRNLKINTVADQFDQEERNRIYQNITYQMRSVMCEAYETIETFKKIYKTDPPKISLSKMNIELPSELDKSNGHMLDLNFFKKAKNFFTKAQKMLKQKKSAKTKKVNSVVKKSKRT